ncbi:TPA: hypothetical protein DEP96_01515 [Candidatus Uhrbacteria bacterium]|nr:hypothetical protein [Candidatus Uhrbacteria bacterium]
MSKGDIVLIPFPFSDLSGHKVRPGLVLYEQKGGEDFIVVFISSVKQAKLGNFDVRIKASQTNGLKADSFIRTDKIATLQKKIVLGELGKLETTAYKLVKDKLRKILAI